jgi:hypothetical protein
MTIEVDIMNLPHQIHADTSGAEKYSYPTHTHGLASIGLPEMFINATCFGPYGNAAAINHAFVEIAESDEKIKAIQEGQEIEISSEDNGEEIITLMLRPVSNKHMGVLAAYGENAENAPVKFAQLYVKGDDHVLEETYFSEAYNIMLNPELGKGCGPECACYKDAD